MSVSVCVFGSKVKQAGCGCFKEFPECDRRGCGSAAVFPPELGSDGGGDVRKKRGGVRLIKLSHCLKSSQTHTHRSTHAPVCGCFIAGRLSHKCHTNLYRSSLMSEPVRYITHCSSLVV